MKNLTTSLIIGFDYNEDKDNAVLIVGSKTPDKDVEIINAFQGDEAKELYEKLTTRKGENV